MISVKNRIRFFLFWTVFDIFNRPITLMICFLFVYLTYFYIEWFQMHFKILFRCDWCGDTSLHVTLHLTFVISAWLKMWIVNIIVWRGAFGVNALGVIIAISATIRSTFGALAALTRKMATNTIFYQTIANILLCCSNASIRIKGRLNCTDWLSSSWLIWLEIIIEFHVDFQFTFQTFGSHSQIVSWFKVYQSALRERERQKQNETKNKNKNINKSHQYKISLLQKSNFVERLIRFILNKTKTLLAFVLSHEIVQSKNYCGSHTQFKFFASFTEFQLAKF